MPIHGNHDRHTTGSAGRFFGGPCGIRTRNQGIMLTTSAFAAATRGRIRGLDHAFAMLPVTAI